MLVDTGQTDRSFVSVLVVVWCVGDVGDMGGDNGVVTLISSILTSLSHLDEDALATLLDSLGDVSQQLCVSHFLG